MSGFPRRLAGPVMGIALFGLLLGGCSRVTPASPGKVPDPPPGSTPAGSETQTNAEGPVTVTVTWKGPQSGLVFRVAMDTHSVDLDPYDLRKLAILRTGNGQEVVPSGWDAPEGGHHRAGNLVFPENLPDGTPLLSGRRTITLVIRDVGGVPERRFQWSW